MLTFQEALDYLYARLPMYQRVGKIAYKKDLDNTVALLKGVGNPENHFKSIHIAGTNGKGTSAHALAAILQMAGYKTGLYTSPHLLRFTERIKINGQEVSEVYVADFITNYRSLLEAVSPSFFECTVAMAFDYFAKEQVDIAVIETGLGGRLDSTNVIRPEVSLITNIGFDHTDLLGDTIEKIAGEKAGIIKVGVPVVIGADMVEDAVKVMQSTADKLGVPLHRPAKFTQRIHPNWPPYFAKNVPGVRSVIEVLRQSGWEISDAAIEEGLANFATLTGLKGRYQRMHNKPEIIADVSHNPDGLRALLGHVRRIQQAKLHVIFGTVQDKDLKPVFAELPRDATYYWTESHVPRRLPVADLQQQARAFGLDGQAFRDVNEAKKAALAAAAPDDLILITGSTFVVAELEGL